MNKFMNFPYTKPNQINVLIEASANCRYQGTRHLIPNVMTEKDFPETYKKMERVYRKMFVIITIRSQKKRCK